MRTMDDGQYVETDTLRETLWEVVCLVLSVGSVIVWAGGFGN